MKTPELSPSEEHEHDWVESLEGPDSVGQHCSICGCIRDDPSEEEYYEE